MHHISYKSWKWLCSGVFFFLSLFLWPKKKSKQKTKKQPLPPKTKPHISEFVCEYVILQQQHKDTFQYSAEYRNSCKLCLDRGSLPESATASFPTKGWPFSVKAKQTSQETLNQRRSSPLGTVNGPPFSCYQHTRDASWTGWSFCAGSPVGMGFHQVMRLCSSHVRTHLFAAKYETKERMIIPTHKDERTKYLSFDWPFDLWLKIIILSAQFQLCGSWGCYIEERQSPKKTTPKPNNKKTNPNKTWLPNILKELC